jgi:hypothetical protein
MPKSSSVYALLQYHGGQILEECGEILVGAQPWGALEGYNPVYCHSQCQCKRMI